MSMTNAAGQRSEDYRALAEQVVRRALAKGADDAEVVINAGREFTVNVRKGEIEKLIEAESRTLGLRLYRDGRASATYTSDLSPEGIEEFVDRALDLALIADPDEFRRLPDFDAQPALPDLNLYDEAIAQLTPAEQIDWAKRCEAALFAADPRITNSDGAEFASETGTIAFANSRGFSGSYPTSGASLQVEAIVDDADQKKRTDYWYTVERSLARRGFFEQWRGIVIVATAMAIFIALLITMTHSTLGGLLIITSLATVAYALFTWSSYTAHDRYIALLGPFARSASLRHWLNTDPQKTEHDLEHLFYHLCHHVLAVQCAYLNVQAGSIRRNFSYRWPTEALPGNALATLVKNYQRHEEKRVKAGVIDENGEREPKVGNKTMQEAQNGADVPSRIPVLVNGTPMICWILPIHDERGLVATLYLGPREDGGAFTDEDMNLAHACGQRILDTLVDHEAMQAVAGLLRRRIVDVKLLGAQQRRVLHDEILPQMHLALLRLETLRSQPTFGIDTQAPSQATDAEGSDDGRQASEKTRAIEETIALITGAHRQLAAMMRATAPGSPHHLERDGMIAAIRVMLDQDFQHAFDEVEWRVSDETAASIDELTPPAIAELVFAAVQEALRNAARHARGSDVHRRLRLTFKASWNENEQAIEIIVADDGVGIASSSGTTSGTGGGLITHSALLAIAGGSLTIKSSPGEGVTVRILLPAGSLR